MQISEWLHEPLRGMLLDTLRGGLAVSLMGAVLSVLVVLKRMSFIGQGVSHSAFGGIGLVALIGAFSIAAGSSAGVTFFVILGFCLLAALGMAMTSDREALESDTAIGVFLVASMALGAVLVAVAGHISRGVSTAARWEQWLFGAVLSTSPADASIAMGISAGVLIALWWFRRPLVFWAFDEPAAVASGVPAARMRLLFIMLLAVTTVTAMKLAGVVYATALLVLPGAAALRLSTRLSVVMFISCLASMAGMIIGVCASIEADLPTGACIVLALTLLFTLACAWGFIRRRLRRAEPSPAPQA